MAYENKRWYDDVGGRCPFCNNCLYYHKDATCDAFPKGIPIDVLRKRLKENTSECANGIKFEPLQKQNN